MTNKRLIRWGLALHIASSVILLISAASLVFFWAAESACDLGVAGGMSRRFYGEKEAVLELVRSELWKIGLAAAALILLSAFVVFCRRVVMRRSPRIAGALIAAEAAGIAALAAFLLLHSLFGRYLPAIRAERQILLIRDELSADRFVVHGGGQIAGAEGEKYSCTNSAESLLNFEENSTTHFLELDLLPTADGDVVCAHEWGSITVDGASLQGPADSETIRRKGHWRDSPLKTALFEDAAALIERRPDVRIVTDTKEDGLKCLEIIAERWPDLRENIVVQIYHEEEYREVTALGFPYVLYTLYRTAGEERQPWNIRKTSQRCNLVGVVFPAKWGDPGELPEMQAWFQLVQELHIPMYGHTVNSKKKMQAAFMRGFAALYTDKIVPKYPGLPD